MLVLVLVLVHPCVLEGVILDRVLDLKNQATKKWEHHVQ